MDETFWNELYGEQERRWSGNANGVLITEVEGMPPGRALDVGCGEGGDALWLAARGWKVTAVDISTVALERAMATSRDVDWRHADLAVTPPEEGAYDLVSLQYFPLVRDAPEHRVLRGLLAAVAPGGTVLIGSHVIADMTAHGAHHAEFDPTAYYEPPEVAALLGDGWRIEVDEIRQRTMPAPPDTPHVRDAVLRARRT